MQVKQKIKRKVSLKKKKELLDNYHSSSESNSDDEAKPNQKDNSSAEEDELSLEENHSEREEDKPIKKSKMSMVINNILNQKCNDNRPVLSQKRRIEIEIDDKKLEERAKKQITLDKKVFNNIGRVIPTNETLPYEKQLRKISTRGVVQLFNALRQAQKTASKQENSDGNLSKETFLKALKDGKPNESNAEKVVSFLREDFQTDKKKHWDQEDDDEI